MIEPEQWNSALSSITGTVVRAVERIANKDVLAFLGLDQRETKRLDRQRPRPWPCDFPEFGEARSTKQPSPPQWDPVSRDGGLSWSGTLAVRGTARSRSVLSGEHGRAAYQLNLIPPRPA
jgi:hypothetical protein